MTEKQMQGYLAYWNDEKYDSIWDLPRVYNPLSGLHNKLDKDYLLGWFTAGNECDHSKYEEYEISEATESIQKKILSPEEAMQNLLLYNKIMKEGGTPEDWLNAIGEQSS